MKCLLLSTSMEDISGWIMVLKPLLNVYFHPTHCAAAQRRSRQKEEKKKRERKQWCIIYQGWIQGLFFLLSSSKWSSFILKEKSLDNRVHVFAAIVGSSKSVDEHEQLSVEETLMLNVIRVSEAAQVPSPTSAQVPSGETCYCGYVWNISISAISLLKTIKY